MLTVVVIVIVCVLVIVIVSGTAACWVHRKRKCRKDPRSEYLISLTTSERIGKRYSITFKLAQLPHLFSSFKNFIKVLLIQFLSIS